MKCSARARATLPFGCATCSRHTDDHHDHCTRFLNTDWGILSTRYRRLCDSSGEPKSTTLGSSSNNLVILSVLARRPAPALQLLKQFGFLVHEVITRLVIGAKSLEHKDRFHALQFAEDLFRSFVRQGQVFSISSHK